MDNMSIVDAIQDVLGVSLAGYEWVLYAAAVVFFLLFMDWTFNLISVVIFHLFSRKER